MLFHTYDARVLQIKFKFKINLGRVCRYGIMAQAEYLFARRGG